MVLQDDINEIINDKNIDWSALKDSTVLITGATGLIGSLCVRVLIALGTVKRIIVSVRDEVKAKKLFGDRVDYYVGDIRMPITIETGVDYIIHCAAVTKSQSMTSKPVDTIDISVNGTKCILDFARKAGIKGCVYVSSMEAYGITDVSQNPVTEEKLGYLDLTAARTSYPESKRLCECLCCAYGHQFGLPVKIARLAQTFGPGLPVTDNRLSMCIAKSVINNEDIVLHTAGLSVINFCYSADSIRGIFTVLLQGEKGEIYNISNDTEIKSVREIAEMVAKRIAKGAIKVVSEDQGDRYGYAPDVVLNLSSKKLIELGWKPLTNLENAYARLIQYLRES